MPKEHIAHMSASGWAFLSVSWIALTWLAVFCVSRVLGSRKKTEPDETPFD